MSGLSGFGLTGDILGAKFYNKCSAEHQNNVSPCKPEVKATLVSETSIFFSSSESRITGFDN